MKTSNIGIVGCGKIAGIYFENLCKRFPMTRVTACADLDMDRSSLSGRDPGPLEGLLERLDRPHVLELPQQLDPLVEVGSLGAHPGRREAKQDAHHQSSQTDTHGSIIQGHVESVKRGRRVVMKLAYGIGTEHTFAKVWPAGSATLVVVSVSTTVTVTSLLFFQRSLPFPAIPVLLWTQHYTRTHPSQVKA